MKAVSTLFLQSPCSPIGLPEYLVIYPPPQRPQSNSMLSSSLDGKHDCSTHMLDNTTTTNVEASAGPGMLMLMSYA